MIRRFTSALLFLQLAGAKQKSHSGSAYYGKRRVSPHPINRNGFFAASRPDRSALVRHSGTLMKTAGDSLLVTFDRIVRPYVLQCTGSPTFQTMTAIIRQTTACASAWASITATSFRTEPICTASVLPSPPGCRRSAHLAPFASLVLFAIDLKNMAQPIEAFLLELAATTLLLASNAVASTLFACAATAIIIIIAVPNTAGLHL
jgi:hypothetical protein